MYLEYWLHEIIKTACQTEPEFRLCVNKGGLNQVTRSDVEAYQNYRLRRVLQYSYDRSSYYRGLFDSAGLKPEDIKSSEELAKLPLTEPYHLAEFPYRFLCISQAEVARPHTFVTSGTTGPQKKVFWTRGDLERITDFMSAGIGTVATQRDVVQIDLPAGRPNSQADLLFKGVRKFGATPVASDVNQGAREFQWQRR